MIWIIFLTAVAPLIGGLVYGFERIVNARMQHRIGPPLLQPFYDMFKLIDKKPLMVNTTHILLGTLHLITLWVAVGILIMGGNLLYVIFIHLLASIFLVAVAPLIGGLVYGFERIVNARMQYRVGPPLLQPFYDMFKLIDKKPLMVNTTHILLGTLHLITLWVAVGILIMGGNLLYVIFIHLLASIFLVLAGFSVRSIYSHIGANRELLTMVAYEPLLILIAAGFYLKNGSFSVATITHGEPLLGSLPLLFVALLLIIPIKLKKSPFDAAGAHQEIVGGVEIEYSGIFFEVLYMAKWLEYVFVYLLVALFGGGSLLVSFGLIVGVFLLINLIDNATARVRIPHLIAITLGFGLTLSLLNLTGIHYGL